MHILLRGHNGGLGIEENIVTLCPKCHYEEDFGQDTKLYEDYIESYLKSIYGANWNKEKLIYKKQEEMKMFKCEKCGRVTQAGEKQHKEIVETRNKTYNYIDKYGKERISDGFEIVKEINVCEKCTEEGNRRKQK